MKFCSGVSLLVFAHALSFLAGSTVHAQAFGGAASVPVTAPPAPIVEWSSNKVEHAYGLPEVKPNRKGQLTVATSGLTFTEKSGRRYSIPRDALLAVNSGNERVELWGVKGRILRMVIPNGGGLAAAGVLHHKVNMLSVEFKDPRNGYHAAVFNLPAGEAERVTSSFTELPPAPHGLSTAAAVAPSSPCAVTPPTRSVLLAMPAWNQADVPSSYRDLLYEHAIERLKKVDGIGHVYRDGETFEPGSCPEYTIQVSVSAFKAGSQVTRAMIGPVGFFVGTTQMAFNLHISNTSGDFTTNDQLKATVRGEGESKTVADSVAKTIAKRFSSETRKYEKSRLALAKPART